MSPRYSILCSGYGCETFFTEVEPLLTKGIKVFWFANRSDLETIRAKHQDFCRRFLLQLFESDSTERIRILDGDMQCYKEEFERLSERVPVFNSRQYLVEHSRAENIIVRASAGTGKTAVMIDRIMFLLHMGMAQPSDIAMITFTNKATDEMERRIQDEVFGRYVLTGDEGYLRLLEQISQMSISTIDSLSLELLKRIGVNVGYSGRVSISSFKKEIRETTEALMDRYYRSSGLGDVRSQLGVDYYDAVTSIIDFFQKISSMGLSSKDVSELDWGIPKGQEAKFQDMLKSVLGDLFVWHQRNRVQADSTPVEDTIRDVNRSITSMAPNVPDVAPRFLFIDEFQDTNGIQIDLATLIAGSWGTRLFVVGDPKQSIYRFRGADDGAFQKLLESLDRDGISYTEYELINNYRTAGDVLERLDHLHKGWVNDCLLDDFQSLVPCSRDDHGSIVVRQLGDWRQGTVFKADVIDAVSDLRYRVETGVANGDEKVAILVRTNGQVDDVARICGSDIPVVCKHDRPLYLSDSVRDFYAMVRSFVYADDPRAKMDFILSPYANISESVVLSELFELNGDRDLLNDLLLDYVDMTRWYHYHYEFERKPALSVIWDIVENTPVVDNYIASLKRKGESDEAYLRDRARQYRANLDKLLTILYRHVSGDSISLYRMMGFLEISIATNRDEMEADLVPESTLVCMTIHSAKGLEFDTVILPSTRRIEPEERSEIIISEDGTQVAWEFYKNQGPKSLEYRSQYYDVLKEADRRRDISEATRLLYVATTRAKHRLVVYTSPRSKHVPESRLIELRGN